MIKHSDPDIFDVVIVGGGPAGIGVSLALQSAGIENMVILERHTVGASFDLWPTETRFITPSFPSNSIGVLDINAVAIGTSPGFSLQTEHPTGEQYASHLCEVAKHFNLPVRQHVDVTEITHENNLFSVHLENGSMQAKHVIWAAGEFQYPRLSGFDGSNLCVHTSTIDSYSDLEGDDFVIIGGYESGVDAAYHLAANNKNVTMIDSGCPWVPDTSDPSNTLSPYSLERINEFWFQERVTLLPDTVIINVTKISDNFVITTLDGTILETKAQPLLAGGFTGSHSIIADLFEPRDDGFPALNEHDESTITSGLYLCGPSVRQENLSFCFIYKFRQRFAVVASSIANSLGMSDEGLELYRRWGIFLDDLSCCGEECEC